MLFKYIYISPIYSEVKPNQDWITHWCYRNFAGLTIPVQFFITPCCFFGVWSFLLVKKFKWGESAVCVCASECVFALWQQRKLQFHNWQLLLGGREREDKDRNSKRDCESKWAKMNPFNRKPVWATILYRLAPMTVQNVCLCVCVVCRCALGWFTMKQPCMVSRGKERFLSTCPAMRMYAHVHLVDCLGTQDTS